MPSNSMGRCCSAWRTTRQPMPSRIAWPGRSASRSRASSSTTLCRLRGRSRSLSSAPADRLPLVAVALSTPLPPRWYSGSEPANGKPERRSLAAWAPCIGLLAPSDMETIARMRREHDQAGTRAADVDPALRGGAWPRLGESTPLVTSGGDTRGSGNTPTVLCVSACRCPLLSRLWPQQAGRPMDGTQCRGRQRCTTM